MTGLRPRLLVLQGGRTVEAREILPGEDWTLGRGPESTIPLPERSISRMHVRIFCDAAGVHLEDLATPNGTFLDGKRIEGVVTLRDGNVIRLGQSTNADPLLLRFEDPGGRLLESIVEPEPAPAPPEPLPAPPDAAAIVKEAATEPAAEEAEGPAVPDKPGFLTAHWKTAAFGLVAVAAVAWMLLRLTSLSQVSWRNVRVEPHRVRAGARLTLRGDDVRPSKTVKVFVADQPAEIEKAERGELVVAVPAVSGAEAGVRTVALKVDSEGMPLFQANVQLETVPEVRSVEPAEAAVGDTVSVKGSGFVSDPARAKVRVGKVVAPVLAASPTELKVRVPVVTRSPIVDLPLDVQVGEWSSAPTSLRIRPRDAPCFALAFTPRFGAQRIWEIRHSLGVAAFMEGAGPADGGAAPARVQQSADALRAAFDKAAADPTVHFEVRDSGRSPAVVLVGLVPSPTEIVRWSPALAAFLRERAPELRNPELVPFWNSVVLNELLNTFAKKQPPRLLPPDSPLRKVLERLHASNLEAGGQGCPSGAEVQTLGAAEREALEAAVLSPPPRFGEVAGAWEGELENVVAEGASDTTLEFRLELEQSGTQLKARAKVAQLKGPGIKVWLPPIDGLEGRVRLGAETRIELTVAPSPPFQIARVSAVVADDTLEGTLYTARSKQGRFRLQFVPE